MKYPKGKGLIVNKNYYKISKSEVSINMELQSNKDMVVVSTDNYCNSEYNGMSLRGWAQSHGFKISDVFEIAIKYNYLDYSDTPNRYRQMKQALKVKSDKKLRKLVTNQVENRGSYKQRKDYRKELRKVLDTSRILFEYRGGMRINVDSPFLDEFYDLVKGEVSIDRRYNEGLRKKKFGDTFIPSSELILKALN